MILVRTSFFQRCSLVDFCHSSVTRTLLFRFNYEEIRINAWILKSTPAFFFAYCTIPVVPKKNWVFPRNDNGATTQQWSTDSQYQQHEQDGFPVVTAYRSLLGASYMVSHFLR
jgi:hypothetical protein